MLTFCPVVNSDGITTHVIRTCSIVDFTRHCWTRRGWWQRLDRCTWKNNYKYILNHHWTDRQEVLLRSFQLPMKLIVDRVWIFSQEFRFRTDDEVPTPASGRSEVTGTWNQCYPHIKNIGLNRYLNISQGVGSKVMGNERTVRMRG